MHRMWVIAALVTAVACEEDRPPAAPPATTDLPLPVIPIVGGPGGGDDGTLPPLPTTTGTTGPGTGDGGVDAGGTIGQATLPTGIVPECQSTCDCALGTACRRSECIPVAETVYCCTDPLCPTGELCETPEGTVSTCP